MENPRRIFISFAIEDKFYRQGLANQAKDERSPFEFVDMSAKEAWDDSWKTHCRTRIRGCDGVIALLSGKTRNAAGARWEISCAIEERKPIIGVWIHKLDKAILVPLPELNGKPKIEWTWVGIKSFLDTL